MISSVIPISSQDDNFMLVLSKSQYGDFKHRTSRKQVKKSIHREKKIRKQKNYLLDPLLQNSQLMHYTSQGFEQSFPSIISTSNAEKPDQFLKRNKLQRVTNQMSPIPQSEKSHQKKYFLFTPQQGFIIILNLATIVVIYMYCSQIPIMIAFQNHRQQATTELVFEYINVPALCIFILGAIIKFRTAYFQHGIMISDTNLIALNYLKRFFAIDLLSIGSILVYQLSQAIHKGPIAYRFIILLFYLKVGQLIKMQTYVINQYDMNRRVKAFLKLFLLLTKIFMLCNIVACGFFFISDYLCRDGPLQNCQECCWTTFIKFDKQPIGQCDWITQYSYSIYWASTTMISIGYGDITPQNPYEMSYTVFVQFASCLVYAYSLNQIWGIIQQLNSKKLRIQHRITVMNTYMRDKKIGPQLKSKIKAYLLHFYYTKNVRQKQLQKDILSDLTPSLKTELFYESYGFIFEGHSFFKNFTYQALEISSQKIIESGYFQEQTIFCPSEEQGQNMLYYIQQGQVQNFIQLRKNRVSIRKIYLQETVGLKQFVTQLNYKSNLVAIKYSVVYKLKFQDWKQSLIQQEQDYQSFYSIRERLVFERNYQLIDVICEICRERNHATEDCFQVQIDNFTEEFLKNYKSKTLRRAFKRENTRSLHLASRISVRNGNMSAFQASITQNKVFKRIQRRQSVDYISFKKDDHSERLRQKKIAHRNQRIHHDIVTQIKNKIQDNMQGHDFEDLYSQTSQMLSTDNIIDKVQNYDFYFPKFNADEQMKNINPRKKMKMLKLF